MIIHKGMEMEHYEFQTFFALFIEYFKKCYNYNIEVNAIQTICPYILVGLCDHKFRGKKKENI